MNISDDTVVESDEIFQLRLSTDEPVVLLPIPAVNVTIIDNDGNLTVTANLKVDTPISKQLPSIIMVRS